MDNTLFSETRAVEDDHFWFVGRGALLTALVKAERARRGGRIGRLVDVGPGTGGLLVRLSRLAEDAVGVELDEAARALASERGANVVGGAAAALPFADGSVDVVTAFDVLEHLDDDTAAGREFRRVLRADGVAVVSVPAYRWLWSEHDDRHAHRRRYTRSRLRRTLQSAGLEVHSCGYFMTVLFPLAVADRVVSKLVRRPPRGLAMPPRRVNEALLRLLLAERRQVLRGGFPFGLSVFAVAGRA